MAAASTFVPLPADAYVLNVAADNTALTLGIVGGAVNAIAVLAERQWILRAAAHPVFDRFSEFIGTNRWIDLAERHMFVGLVVGGFSFLPFEPFRLVAVLRGYDQLRYAVATFFGRGIRYYWLAQGRKCLCRVRPCRVRRLGQSRLLHGSACSGRISGSGPRPPSRTANLVADPEDPFRPWVRACGRSSRDIGDG